jgi:insulysin
MDIPLTHSTGDSPREYHFLTLANGLRTCLISDASADKAAAAVAVMAGQMQDSMPGIAHLTEHMLFMGSTSFPGENEYDQYIQQAGGHSNAYTDLEQTVFYFDVSAIPKFRGGLERLCAALSEPCIQASSLERELQAVDAEHSKNVTQDHWRTHQLTRSLLGCNASDNDNKKHPYSNFGTGNKTSLLQQTIASGSSDKEHSDTDETDVSPSPEYTAAAYEALRRAILEFYQAYYRAPNMTLAVLGPQSIAELQGLVEEIFATLPPLVAEQSAETMSGIPNTIPPLPEREAVTVVQWVPLAGGDNSASLELQWIVRDDTDSRPLWFQYESKPAHVWSHLLGHEGPGSLLAALRDLQWAQDLSADDSSGNTRSFSLFTLHITLTSLGLEHVVDVLHMIFYYIDTVLVAGQGIPDWVYDELKVAGDNAFTFLSKRDAASTVSSLAAHMHQYRAEHYLSGPYRIFSHDVAVSQRIGSSTLSHARNLGRNLLILLGSTEYATVTDTVDPWYGTQYRVVPMTGNADNVWTKLSAVVSSSTTVTAPEWASSLHLPAQNDMLPTDFTLVAAHEDAPTILSPWWTSKKGSDAAPSVDSLEPETMSLPPTPRCLVDTATCRLWYKPDLTYQTPKANLIAALRAPVLQNSYGSPETAVLSSLWVHVATELCNDFAYAASMAGLHCGFSEGAGGSIELSISGYNHKAGILLRRICDTLVSALPLALSEPADGAGDGGGGGLFFERIRNKLEHQYETALASAPYMHGSMVADLLLEASNP